MPIPHTLIIITVDPTHPIAEHAYRYVSALLQSTLNNSTSISTANNAHDKISLFFYGESAQTANALRWQVADRDNLTEKWQRLSQKYDLTLPVCVSTAITRGVTDTDNAQRHKLNGNNLAKGFSLVGLGELADRLNKADKVIQF